MRAPNLGPLQRLTCLAGQHRRDRRRVRTVIIEGRQFHSAPCAGCGVIMAKDRGTWRLLTREEIAAIDAERRTLTSPRRAIGAGSAMVAKEGFTRKT